MTINNPVRENIIATTLNFVLEKGYSATSVKEIIKNSNAPKGSIYYYFPKGKDEIFIAALDKIDNNVKKKIKSLENKHKNLEDYLLGLFKLFDKKNKTYSKANVQLILLALETIEISPIITEKCSEILEGWRYLVADNLFDMGIPEEICNPVSEWFFLNMQGAICSTKIHSDTSFLHNINICIDFITKTEKELLIKIFSE